MTDPRGGGGPLVDQSLYDGLHGQGEGRLWERKGDCMEKYAIVLEQVLLQKTSAFF